MLNELKRLNIITTKGKVNNNKDKIIAKNNDIAKKIEQSTNFLLGNNITLYERIYAILYELKSQPVCKNCQVPLRIDFSLKNYRDFCSAKCSINNKDQKNKRKTTSLRKYGTEHPCQSEAIKTKISESHKSHTTKQNTLHRQKRDETCIEKYGTTDPMKLQKFIEKRKQTCIKKYGVEYACQSPETRKKISSNHYKRMSGDINNQTTLETMNNTMSLREISKSLNVSPSVISSRFKKLSIPLKLHQYSLPEKEIKDFLEKEQKVKDIIVGFPLKGKKHIDMFLPEYNLGIEVDGVYWHSEKRGGKDREYHSEKTNECIKRGIQLIHIWDIEWNLKTNIVKSKLTNILGNSNRIFARNTKISRITSKEEFLFLEENHLQGGVYGKECYGLIYDNEIVSIMSFTKNRFSKSNEWELLRYCNKNYKTVVGGASKLFKHFILIHNPLKIISFSDRKWATGGLYKILDFKFEKNTSPNYWYFHENNTNKIFSRQKFQKHKLEKILPIYEEKHSEWDNMLKNGYDRIWDCGSQKWIWEA